MTKNIVLNAKKRIAGEKAADEHSVPAILYGREIENVMLWIGRKDFDGAYGEIGESTIFRVAIDGKDERNVLVKEIQRDVTDGRIRHIDFYQVRMDEKIEAEVELAFKGESPAVKELGGVLVKNMDTIEVRCLPGDLPSEIEVDISRFKTFDDYVYVKDLSVSEKVEVLIDLETVVAMVLPPRSEEELAELETEVKEDVTQVEGVVKEEKPEEKEVEAEVKEEKEGKEKEEGKEDEKKQ